MGVLIHVKMLAVVTSTFVSTVQISIQTFKTWYLRIIMKIVFMSQTPKKFWGNPQMSSGHILENAVLKPQVQTPTAKIHT